MIPPHAMQTNNRYHNSVLTYGLLLLCFAATCNPVHALDSDKIQTAHFAANQASFNQQTHRGIYNGNVQLDQGSTHLRADQTVTQTDTRNQLLLAIAKGGASGPAHAWTTPNAQQLPLHAFADIIRYEPQAHRILLIGHARLVQGEQSFSAAKITYDLREQHLMTSPHKQESTQIIIYNHTAVNPT